MARLTKEDKENILADYHTGIYSNNELAKRYSTSHTTVNKMVKGMKQKNKDLVSSQITTKTTLAEQSFKEVSAVETAVETKTKHLEFFTNSALKNQSLANKKLNENLSLNDLESHSRITSRNKDSVLGKEPTNKIDITQQQAQTNQIIEIEIE